MPAFSDPLAIIGAGDSIGGGQGGSTASGATPSGVTLSNNGGGSLSDWQDNGGSIPSPGHWPSIVDALRTLGYTGDIDIFRRYTTGHTLQQILNQHLPNAFADAQAAGKVPKLAVIVGGTNNCDVGESALIAPVLRAIYELCGANGCRVIHMSPAVVDPGPAGDHSEADEVRAIIDSVAAEYDHVVVATGVGVATSLDQIHIAEGGYDSQGANGVSLWWANG